MNPGTPEAAPTPERCDACGKPRQSAPGTSSPAPSVPPETVAPGTHCEWCGAEYEAPGGGA